MTGWDEVERASVADLLAWAEDEPWARAMAACAQDAGWHAEGDVWTHTRMVAAELERLDGWADLDAPDRLRLAFTALFHDAGKPATTAVDAETGRTRSPKHSQVGERIARRVLRGLGCPLGFREEVAGLVRYHGRPPYLLEKTDPAREVIALSWTVDHRLLYLFALADTRGRRTAAMARPEDTLHLWKLAAEEAGCWDRPYPFANDHARFLFFRDELSSLHYAPREAYRCTVSLTSGLPGAGKDTWLAANRPDLPVVSLDDIRGELDVGATDDQGAVVQAAKERCREHLRAGRDFAFNATNTVRTTRRRWVDLFADYGARVEVVYLEPPPDVLFRQNAGRRAGVPRRVIEHLLERLEPPTRGEGHAVELLG
jgi:putative nucleotidyltransferase with HDIG domain